MKKHFDLQKVKETAQQLEQIQRFGYSYSTIFADFLDTCLYALLSLTENMQCPDGFERLQHNKLSGIYEDCYLQLVRKYPENKTGETGKRPIDSMTHAWGLLQKETADTRQDVLGEIFMANVSFGELGQFFTPAHIADTMAQMLFANQSRHTVCDPCCGSGRFFISASKFTKKAHYYGVDLSPTCAKMTALNMWLFDLDADIYHGDSLAMQYFQVWRIRRGGFLYEAKIEQTDPFMPKAVHKTFQVHAEQQKLFNLEEFEKKE